MRQKTTTKPYPTIEDIQPAPEPDYPWMRKPEEFYSPSVETLFQTQEILLTYDKSEDIKRLDIGCVFVETIRCESAFDRLVSWLSEKFEKMAEDDKPRLEVTNPERDNFRFHVAKPYVWSDEIPDGWPEAITTRYNSFVLISDTSNATISLSDGNSYLTIGGTSE